MSMSGWHARLSSVVLSWSIITIIPCTYSVGVLEHCKLFQNIHIGIQHLAHEGEVWGVFLWDQSLVCILPHSLHCCIQYCHIWPHYNGSQIWGTKYVAFTVLFWWGSHGKCLYWGKYPTGGFCTKKNNYTFVKAHQEDRKTCALH